MSVGAPVYCKGCSENLGKTKMLLCQYKEYSDECELAKGIEKKGRRVFVWKVSGLLRVGWIEE